jgi:hypothetical protein
MLRIIRMGCLGFGLEVLQGLGEDGEADGVLCCYAE